MNAIIQNRRGAYSNVIPSKLLPGEIAVVTSDDPASPSGESVYIGTKTGTVQRLAFDSEVTDANIQAQRAAAQAQEALTNVSTINTQVQEKLNTVNTKAQQVETNASAASTAAQTATTKANEATQASTNAQTASQTSVKVLGSMAPAYDATKTYTVGDLVINDNKLYECNTDITTPEAWNDSHWVDATVEDELTNLKEDISDIERDVFFTERTYPYKTLSEFFTEGSFTDRNVGPPSTSGKAIAITSLETYNSYYVTITNPIDIFFNKDEIDAYLCIAKVTAPVTKSQGPNSLTFNGSSAIRYRTVDSNLPTENNRLHFNSGDVAIVSIKNLLSPNSVKFYYGSDYEERLIKTLLNDDIKLQNAQVNIASNFMYKGLLVKDLHYTSIAQCEEGTYYFQQEDKDSISDLPENWLTGGLIVKTAGVTYLTTGNVTYVKWRGGSTWQKIGESEYIKISAKFIKNINRVPGLYCIAASGTKRIYFMHTNSLGYDSYYIKFQAGTKIYFDDDLDDCPYLSLCIGDAETDELIPIDDGTDTRYYIQCSDAPYRIRKTASENTLPYGIENAIDVGNKLVAITYDHYNPDYYFNIRGLSLSQCLPISVWGLGDSLLPVSQDSLTYLFSIPPKTGYLNYTIRNDIPCIDIYIPVTSNSYIKYIFEHRVRANINADIWRIEAAYLNNRLFEDIGELTTPGEWECALKLTGRDDFSGGRMHGDEIYNYIAFIKDGVEIQDITSINMMPFHSLTILQKSTLYDPNDNVTEIANHYSEHIFSCYPERQLRIKQTIEWIGDHDISACFLAMFPINKEWSDSWYNDYTFEKKPIEYGVYKNIKEITIYSTTNNVISRFGVNKYVEADYSGNGELSITDNGGNRYNKCYYKISQGGKDDASGHVTDGTIWQTESYYEFTRN